VFSLGNINGQQIKERLELTHPWKPVLRTGPTHVVKFAISENSSCDLNGGVCMGLQIPTPQRATWPTNRVVALMTAGSSKSVKLGMR
jgi:hypothetical protein